MDGRALDELAREHGTPLYVASAASLRRRCAQLAAAFAGFPRPVRLHFSYKTNLVAGVLGVLHGEGLGAEVVNGYELWLARKLGVDGARIVFNGPNKTDEELSAALAERVGLIVCDGLAEVKRLEALSDRAGAVAPVALRVCPDVVPKGMNASTGTGSRKNQFGFDLGSAELAEAMRACVRSARLRLRGVHVHIGSGIHDLDAFRRAARRALEAQAQALRSGAQADVLDLGGGLGTAASREFSSLGMLWYLATGRLPRPPDPEPPGHLARYAQAVGEAVQDGARELSIPVPELVLEPGRAVVSDSQVLLLRVGAVKERAGVGRFALTDGGAMSTSMMFLSEHHAVLLAGREAPEDGCTSLFGRVPSPLDVLYRRLPMPRLREGDVLAVTDAGAYFTSTSTNFGGPRAAVLLLDGGEAKLVRRRETFEDLARVELSL